MSHGSFFMILFFNSQLLQFWNALKNDGILPIGHPDLKMPVKRLVLLISTASYVVLICWICHIYHLYHVWRLFRTQGSHAVSPELIIHLTDAGFRVWRFGFVVSYFINSLVFLTSRLCLAQHRRGLRVGVRGYCRNAGAARSLYRRLCCTVPMTTRASSLHFYGNRHMGKYKQSISQWFKNLHNYYYSPVLLVLLFYTWFSNAKGKEKLLFSFV